MAHADRVLFLVDAAAPEPTDIEALAEQIARLAPGVPFTLVFNKIDLAGRGRSRSSMRVRRAFI